MQPDGSSWASPSRGAKLCEHQRPQGKAARLEGSLGICQKVRQGGAAARRQGGRQEMWLGIAEAGAQHRALAFAFAGQVPHGTATIGTQLRLGQRHQAWDRHGAGCPAAHDAVR